MLKKQIECLIASKAKLLFLRHLLLAKKLLMDPEAILPVTFKLGEQEDGTPIYHQFTTAEELTQFYLQAAAYKNQCLADGWAEKDSIDWAPYEALFPQQEQVNEPTE